MYEKEWPKKQEKNSTNCVASLLPSGINTAIWIFTVTVDNFGKFHFDLDTRM